MGLLLAVWVHSAALQDKTAAKTFVRRVGSVFQRLVVVFADLGYDSSELSKLVKRIWKAELQLKKHPWQGRQAVWVKRGQKPPPAPVKPKGFVVLPKRWIVERTFAWVSRFRRHSKDYEGNPENSAAFIRVSMIQIMLRRLTRSAS
jgi:putative transposase